MYGLTYKCYILNIITFNRIKFWVKSPIVKTRRKENNSVVQRVYFSASRSLSSAAGTSPSWDIGFGRGLWMREMGEVDSFEEMLGTKKKKNPFVPLGAFITAGVLTAGLISYKQGNSKLGQQLMRARVVVQGATVALMVGSAYYYGEHFRGAKNQN